MKFRFLFLLTVCLTFIAGTHANDLVSEHLVLIITLVAVFIYTLIFGESKVQ